jgi:hypothetical protein
MIKCGYEVQLADTGEILRCVMDEHPGASIHSTGCEEFRKVGDGLFMVRQFSDGLRLMRQQAHGSEVW